MSRSVPEWVGKNDDEAIPTRVKVRIFDLHNGRCAACTRAIWGSLKPAYDHIIALINGGENRESNLQLLCVPCHKPKTANDVAEKAVVARKRKTHLGIRKPSRFVCSRNSPWKKTISGKVVRR